MASSSSVIPASLRVAGTWSGLLNVPDLATWTVRDLRSAIGDRAGVPAVTLTIICAGHKLKDGPPEISLTEAGVTSQSKLLVTRAAVLPGAEEAAVHGSSRSFRLDRLRAVAEKMAASDGSRGGRMADYDLQLENQSGQLLAFDHEEDRKALMMGLMLHARSRGLIDKLQYSEALEVLAMAEEAFSLCNRKHLEAVDNIAMLHLDTVWCYLQLQDASSLSTARNRLSMARNKLETAHGKSMERLRLLHSGFCPELATYVRLDLLEGVAAFYSNNFSAARDSLRAAQEKYSQLQVSEDSIGQLGSMGFSKKESIRALRMSRQNVTQAVGFVMEQRERNREREEADNKRRKERREQRGYGKTASGKLVDMGKLRELEGFGCDRREAAEALRQADNEREGALETLMDPEGRRALQVALKNQKRQKRVQVDKIAFSQLVAMGYDAKRVKKALEASENNQQEAVELLLGGAYDFDETETEETTVHRNSRKGRKTENATSGGGEVGEREVGEREGEEGASSKVNEEEEEEEEEEEGGTGRSQEVERE